jgi:hypothetical protein
MKKILFILFILVSVSSFHCFAQEQTEWQEDLTLTADHFLAESPQTQNMQTIRPAFAIQIAPMLNYEIVFGKNFNDKVTCYLMGSASWLDEGEHSAQLLRYAKMAFDIYELSTRKLRKDMLENKSKLSPNKLNELHQKNFEEGAKMDAAMAKETNYGANNEALAVWEEKIKGYLVEYANYCKTCKPEKKKSK